MGGGVSPPDSEGWVAPSVPFMVVALSFSLRCLSTSLHVDPLHLDLQYGEGSSSPRSQDPGAMKSVCHPSVYCHLFVYYYYIGPTDKSQIQFIVFLIKRTGEGSKTRGKTREPTTSTTTSLKPRVYWTRCCTHLPSSLLGLPGSSLPSLDQLLLSKCP